LSHPAFSKRYFHLKSHNVEDLDKAVETKIWSTQPHNEAFLDQAFRHSEVVYLFFSANQSGRFYGYAKMTGGIAPNSKQQESSSSAGSQPSVGTFPPAAALVEDSPENLTPAEEVETPASDAKTPAAQAETPASDVDSVAEEVEEPLSQTWPLGPEAPARKTSSADGVGDESVGSSGGEGVVYSDSSNNHRLKARGKQRKDSDEVETSTPAQGNSNLSAEESAGSERDSAYPKLPNHTSSGDALSTSSQSADFLDDIDRALDFSTSPSKESRAAEQHITRSLIHNLRLDQIDSQEKVERLQRTLDEADRQLPDAPAEGEGSKRLSASSTSPGGKASPPSPAHPFTIEWLQTVPLPFGVVKHLRNPWNENKSVRVGRDGTELAVETGAELLRIWDDYARNQDMSSSPSRS
jgi:hypothetical protein